jgi:hypothetical protein
VSFEVNVVKAGPPRKRYQGEKGHMKAIKSLLLRKSLFLQSIWISSLLIAACTPSFAQNGNATITGTVEDSAGAVVAGAQVAIT